MPVGRAILGGHRHAPGPDHTLRSTTPRKAARTHLPSPSTSQGDEYRPSRSEPPIRYDASEWYRRMRDAAPLSNSLTCVEPMEPFQCPMPNPGRRRP